MNDLRRALTGSSEAPVLTFVREFRTSPEDLREALSRPDRVTRWLGTLHGEPRAVGDQFTLALGGQDDIATCRVRTCDDDGFQIDWSWPGELDSIVTVLMEPSTNGTLLTLTHALNEAGLAADYGGGWEHHLSVLARSLGAQHPVVDFSEASTAWSLLARSPRVIERDISAAVDQVWAAFATASGLRAWWWNHWPEVKVEADVRLGGTYCISAAAQGISVSGRYLSVEPIDHLAFTWSWRDNEGTSTDEAVDMRLQSHADGTRLTLFHSGPWANKIPADNYRQGWADTLGQLADVLAR